MRYGYKIKNVKDPEQLLKVVGGFKGVENAVIENDTLFYDAEDSYVEYSVMSAAFDECDRQGGSLIISEEQVFGKNIEIKAEGEDVAQEIADDQVIDGDFIIEKKEIPDYVYESDRLITEKKRIKSETITRIAELSVSLILLIISLLIKSDETASFSFNSVLTILSFAISAYECLYNAIIDIVKKRWWSENIYIGLAYIAGALLGYVIEISVIALVFAAGKELETFRKETLRFKTEETFYTGSFSVALDGGETKAISALEKGDTFLISQYDVVPCDGVCLTDGLFDCYKTEFKTEKTVKAGESVAAGSVLLSEKAKITVEKKNADSFLSVAKKEFESKLKEYGKTPSFLKWVMPAAFIIALVTTLVLALTSDDGFAFGIYDYGHIGLLITFCGCVYYLIRNVFAISESAVVEARCASADFSNKNAFDLLGKANSFVFSAGALTENKKIKEDAFGALTELINCGAKNVTTDFTDCDLPAEVAKKIDFVDRSPKKEKKITVGANKDLSLGDDGEINILNGQISFVPYIYKIAKRAKNLRKLSVISCIIAYAATIALCAIFGLKASLIVLPVIAATVVINLSGVISQREKV